MVNRCIPRLVLAAAALLFAGSFRQSGPAQEETEVERIGREAAQTVMSRLQQELGRAIAAGGAVGAIDVCSRRALELTREVSQEHTGVAVKRSSLKYRNPANAPDEWERLVLQEMEAEVARGGSPVERIQRVSLAGESVYRYYRPLFMGEVCLNCHGDPAKFSAPLSAALQQRYPADLATGYGAGDFRGVIRVQVSEEALR